MLTVKTLENGHSINGTSLQGYVNYDYATLCRVFGKETNNGDGYKVDASWELEFSDGVVATIYNWKNGKNYCGSEGTATNEISNWHVGGHNKQALANVVKLLLGTTATLA